VQKYQPRRQSTSSPSSPLEVPRQGKKARQENSAVHCTPTHLAFTRLQAENERSFKPLQWYLGKANKRGKKTPLYTVLLSIHSFAGREWAALQALAMVPRQGKKARQENSAVHCTPTHLAFTHLQAENEQSFKPLQEYLGKAKKRGKKSLLYTVHRPT